MLRKLYFKSDRFQETAAQKNPLFYLLYIFQTVLLANATQTGKTSK